MNAKYISLALLRPQQCCCCTTSCMLLSLCCRGCHGGPGGRGCSCCGHNETVRIYLCEYQQHYTLLGSSYTLPTRTYPAVRHYLGVTGEGWSGWDCWIWQPHGGDRHTLPLVSFCHSSDMQFHSVTMVTSVLWQPCLVWQIVRNKFTSSAMLEVPGVWKSSRLPNNAALLQL